MQSIMNFFDRLIEGPEIWLNKTYRKVMKGFFGLVFGYLGVLWYLACNGGAGSITMVIWAFLPLFTFIYWMPRAGGLAALIEWFRDKDDPKKKSVWILYLLIVISAIVAGSLAIILQQIDAGTQFPVWVLALLTIVVICLILPEKAKLDIWLPRIGAVVVALALFGTVMGGLSKWSTTIYNKSGYTLSSPNKAEVAARKATAENKVLADQATEQCIVDWKNAHMRNRVVRQDQIATAVRKCQEQGKLVSPSAEVAAQEVIEKNRRLADQGAKQCIESWEKKYMGSGKVVREDQIAAAVRECQKEWFPVSSSSQKEEVGEGTVTKKSDIKWYENPSDWVKEIRARPDVKWYEHPIDWTVQHPIGALIVILTHGGVVWWIRRRRNKNTLVAATATKTIVVSSSSPIAWRTPVVFLIMVYLFACLLNWGWVTPSTVSQWFTQRADNSESTQVKTYPNAFLTPKEVKTWQAVGTYPNYHPNFGEIAGRAFFIETGARNGMRPTVADKMEGGYGKPLLIELEENNPNRDIVLENITCNEPKIYSDNEVHTVCVSKWRSGDRSIGGTSELIYNSESRVARLSYANTSGTIEVIIFEFRPK
jgi:hypothetical protein